MNNELKTILLDNAKEYYKNALDAETRGEYNTSVTLFFKTISALCDIYILVKIGRIPSNHTERFRILESSFPGLYKIIDKGFPFYQDSYRIKLNKEVSDLLKEDARKIFELLDIGM